jgi:hypothetical protein
VSWCSLNYQWAKYAIIYRDGDEVLRTEYRWGWDEAYDFLRKIGYDENLIGEKSRVEIMTKNGIPF